MDPPVRRRQSSASFKKRPAPARARSTSSNAAASTSPAWTPASVDTLSIASSEYNSVASADDSRGASPCRLPAPKLDPDDAYRRACAGEDLSKFAIKQHDYHDVVLRNGMHWQTQADDRCQRCKDRDIPCTMPAVRFKHRANVCLPCSQDHKSSECTRSKGDANKTKNLKEANAARTLYLCHDWSTLRDGTPGIFTVEPTMALARVLRSAGDESEALISEREQRGPIGRAANRRRALHLEEARAQAEAASLRRDQQAATVDASNAHHLAQARVTRDQSEALVALLSGLSHDRDANEVTPARQMLGSGESTNDRRQLDPRPPSSDDEPMLLGDSVGHVA